VTFQSISAGQRALRDPGIGLGLGFGLGFEVQVWDV